jgi:hypothetical protein
MTAAIPSCTHSAWSAPSSISRSNAELAGIVLLPQGRALFIAVNHEVFCLNLERPRRSENGEDRHAHPRVVRRRGGPRRFRKVRRIHRKVIVSERQRRIVAGFQVDSASEPVGMPGGQTRLHPAAARVRNQNRLVHLQRVEHFEHISDERCRSYPSAG